MVFVVNSLSSPDESESPPGTANILLRSAGAPIDASARASSRHRMGRHGEGERQISGVAAQDMEYRIGPEDCRPNVYHWASDTL